MNLGPRLVDPALDALFAIPRASWQATLDRSVLVQAGVIRADGEAPDWAPVSQACKNACVTWLLETYGDILDHASRLASSCEENVAGFTRLKNQISALEPSDGLSADIRNTASTVLARYAATATALSGSFHLLAPVIVDFLTLNLEADPAIAAWAGTEAWPEIAPSASMFDTATQRVLGAWNAVTDDLEALALPPEKITLTFLLDLDIESSLLAWADLGNQAVAFTDSTPQIGT